MIAGNAQPEALLQAILKLDLATCNIDVCLASDWQSKGQRSFRRVMLTSDIGERFREAINTALKPYKDGLESSDIELHEFAAESTLPENEIEYLDFFPYDSIRDQIRPLETYLDMAHFEHSDHAFIHDLRFYVIRVQPPQGEPIYYYRRYSQSQMLSQSPWFGMRPFQSDLYSDVTEPTFLFDRHIDCISYEEHMFILQKHNFFHIFDFAELEKVARETLDKLEKKDFIHNFQRFKRDCLQDKNKILKLKNISTRPYLDTITIDDLHKTIQDYDLPILVRLVGHRKKMFYDPRKRWEILKLLDDGYVLSNMTSETYYAKSKRGVKK
jgi:hypothetical protein